MVLAKIVEQITVEGDPRNVVHTNLVLIRADSPEEAYPKAVELGAAGEQSYENLDGTRVEFRFRGLRELSVIYDELEHGAELTYSEDVGWDMSPWANGSVEPSGKRATRAVIEPETKLNAVRRAAQYAFPTADVEQMLNEIERGYGS
jgi:Domain of unknown function (DUF4288)